MDIEEFTGGVTEVGGMGQVGPGVGGDISGEDREVEILESIFGDCETEGRSTSGLPCLKGSLVTDGEEMTAVVGTVREGSSAVLVGVTTTTGGVFNTEVDIASIFLVDGLESPPSSTVLLGRFGTTVVAAFTTGLTENAESPARLEILSGRLGTTEEVIGEFPDLLGT